MRGYFGVAMPCDSIYFFSLYHVSASQFRKDCSSMPPHIGTVACNKFPKITTEGNTPAMIKPLHSNTTSPNHTFKVSFFIYGLTIKKETLNMWFGDVVFECNGLIMAGVFPSVVILGNLLQATVPICGGIDEQSFRNWLADTWYSEKKYIESQG